jgi:hypothetical protein
MFSKNRQAKGKALASPGETNPAAKVTWEIVEMIRRTYPTGQYSKQQLADMWGINQQSVSNIILHKTWHEP